VAPLEVTQERLRTVAGVASEDTFGRPFFVDVSGVHHDDAIGDFSREIHFMGDYHHGHSIVCEVSHDVEHFARQLRVERAGGFVE
jgi:hypothetical protein